MELFLRNEKFYSLVPSYSAKEVHRWLLDIHQLLHHYFILQQLRFSLPRTLSSTLGR